jgi:hypothetical protein
MAERNHEIGTPALVKSIPSQDTKKRETDPIFIVAVLLDGTCPPSSSLSTQAVSAGLSTKILEALLPKNLKKKKKVIFLCTEAWPQYPLGNQDHTPIRPFL